MEGVRVQIRAVFHGIHPGQRRSFHRPGAVGVGHYGKAFLVGNMDQLPDGFRGKAVLGQHTEAIKIHQTGDHDFDKIRAFRPLLSNHSGILGEIFVLFPNKAAVVTLRAQRRQRRAVGDAVLPRQRPGFRPHAPAVAAVTEVGKAQLLVSFQHPANPDFIHAPGMPGDRPLPVRAVQNHVNMTIAPHGKTLPFRLSITDFGRLCKHGHFS